MKSKLTFFITLGIMGLFVVMFSGCYTQLESTRDEQIGERENYNDTQSGLNNNDTTYDNRQSNYYADDDFDRSYPHSRVGFSYYYPSYYWPSYAFSVAYNDPWFYDSYWAYDPWWCGTPYVTYPIYGSRYYSPYYYPYGQGGYSYSDYSRHSGSRPSGLRVNTTNSPQTGNGEILGNSPQADFSKRDRDNFNAPSGGISTPLGSGVYNNGGQANKNNPPDFRDRSRPSGTSSGYTPRNNATNSNRTAREWGSRKNTPRGESARTRTGSQERSSNPPPTTDRNGGTRGESHTPDFGSPRGSATPSYSPPPTRNSAPSPSSQGGERKTQSNGNSRGKRP